MISVQDIVDRAKSELDAEGSDRYLFDQDFKPAINSAVEWITAVFNAAFSNKKLSEEQLRELIRTVVWQMSEFSRFYFDPVATGDKLWSVIGISPKPTVHPVLPLVPTSAPEKSVFRGDMSFISSEFSTNRMTPEQWNEGSQNVFEAGNTILDDSLVVYAHKNPSNYGSSNYDAGGEEFEIRPSVAKEYIGLEYLRYPEPVVLITDFIAYPNSLIDLIVNKTLNVISVKQGDQTNLFSVTQQDISTLVSIMV
jgi:hypothetical protein